MIELTLPDMTCGHCVKAVTAAVQALDAQAQVHADVVTHRVQIETTQPLDLIKATLAQEGYPPAA